MAAMDAESSGDELHVEPNQYMRPRKGGVCAEPYHKGYYYKMPFWNKLGHWEHQLYMALQKCATFKQYTGDELIRFVQAMEIHKRFAGEYFGERGEVGDGLFIVLEGEVDCYYDAHRLVATRKGGEVIDEAQILFGLPRSHTLKAKDECVCGKLRRVDFINLSVRLQLETREKRQFFLRTSKLMEMMEDEQIAQLTDVLEVREYQADSYIIKQGDEGGKEFFILESGEAVVNKKTADDIQEYRRYYGGELFGEVSLMTKAPRAANVIAVKKCIVLVLARAQFERFFGPMADLQAQQYQTDPRKLIADFYDISDGRGPRGTLNRAGLTPDPKANGESNWFVVYRPTSRDAIAKMLSGNAVGKGLNVKGKSAKKGILSGYVPFVQISDNKHKPMIEKSPPNARLKIYFKTKPGREEARKALLVVAAEMSKTDQNMQMAEDYAPTCFGLEISEALMREAYIMRPDLSPIVGWETGRASEPAYMDFNLHSIRDGVEPKVVLYQFDESDSMNPRGLLVAYAEKLMKPVVSDFDTFTVGSKGFKYESLPLDQAKLVTWVLEHTENVLNSLDENGWTSRWLDVIQKEAARGFHPKLPKYGFGDPTSYSLIGDVVEETAPCGAVRHGAECSNFFFPQELDDQYLIVWYKYPDKPWEYVTEEGLRKFLLDRVAEGFAFPLNPVWCVRDKGDPGSSWYDILLALEANPTSRGCLDAWFPASAGILERVHRLHKEHPDGFRIVDNLNTGGLAKEVKIGG